MCVYLCVFVCEICKMYVYAGLGANIFAKGHMRIHIQVASKLTRLGMLFANTVALTHIDQLNARKFLLWCTALCVRVSARWSEHNVGDCCS